MSQKDLTFIDLFAGAGGLSEGFIRAGFKPLAHVEMNNYACDTLRTRAAFHYLKGHNRLDIYKEYLNNKKDKEDGQKLWQYVPQNIIDTVIQSEIGGKTIDDIFDKIDAIKGKHKIDIIIGGPPCQAYSIAGRARMGKDVENDPRNELYKYYVKFLEYYKPKMFVFENVLGIRTAKGGVPFRDLQQLVRSLGYEIEFKEQVASEHGVLQKRHRMIIVGWKRGSNLHYPELKAEDCNYKVLKDLFSDLPIRKAGEGDLCKPIKYIKSIEEMPYLKIAGIRNNDFDFTTQHIARPNNINDKEIYVWAIKKWYKEGKQLSYKDIPADHQKHKNKETFLNRFSVVNPNGICHTVVAHIAMDGHYYIYPNPKPTVDNVRSITIREAARLQSFPDDYFFEGSRSAAFRQIGNAVPVVLAYKIALEISKMLS